MLAGTTTSTARLGNGGICAKTQIGYLGVYSTDRNAESRRFKSFRCEPLNDWLEELDLQRGRGGLSLMQA